MSWFDDSSSKVYETDDWDEYLFLSSSTSWDVRYTGAQDDDPVSNNSGSKSFDVDEALRQAYAKQGIDYDERTRTRRSEKEYAVTSSAEIQRLARRAKAEIQQEREEVMPNDPFEMYSELIANSLKLEKAGAVEAARNGYGAAINLLQSIHERICKVRGLGEDTVKARQALGQKIRVVKKRRANL